MSKPKFLLWSAICLLLVQNIAAQAEGSFGIRLGTTDFGGQSPHQQQRSGSTDSNRNQHGSFKNSHREHRDYKYRNHRSGSDKYNHKYRSNDQTGYGINGYPSYGYTPKSHRQQKHHDYNQRPYRDYHHDPRGVSAYYGYNNHLGISFYSAPIGYSSYSYSAAPNSLSDHRYQPYSYTQETTDTYIDPWQALGDYQLDTARYAFESQMQQQPNAALPKVGYALSKALSGDIEAGAYLMENALLSNVADLRYFNASADPDLQLVIKELLLSYRDDPLMSASLYYLNTDYRAASLALQQAHKHCEQCTAIDNLALLIEQHQ